MMLPLAIFLFFMETVLFVLVLLIVVQLGYWIFLFSKLSAYEPIEDVQIDIYPPVSIVICYKNAEKTIKNTVLAVLIQNYPTFEVVLVNDFSDDESKNIVRSIDDNRIRHIDCTKNIAGKKQALFEGIQAAKYEILLLTDADCLPDSTEWISKMVTNKISNQTQVVLGYGPLRPTKKFVSQFSNFETVMTALQYFSYCLAKIPYMGVGRNILYEKSLFLSKNNLIAGKTLSSGDDDLWINSISNQVKMSISIDPKTFVYSETKQTWRDFFIQKSRHVSVSPHYKTRHKILLFIFSFSNIGIYLVAFFSLVMGILPFSYWFLLFCSKWLVQTFLHFKAFKLLHTKNLWQFYPIYEILFSCYHVVLLVFGLSNKKNTW